MPGIGLEYGIAGLLGEGLKGFADSYGAEKDRQRKQAEADDERAYRARQMEASDFDSGRVWDGESKTYKAREGEGLLTKSEQKLLSGGLEARKAFGEDWYRKENEPLRTAVDALLRKQFGAQTAPTQSALPGGAGLMPRTPDAAPVATVGGVSMPKKSAGLMKPVANRVSNPAPAPANLPPYEIAARQIENTPIVGFNQGDWSPGFLPKSAKEQKQKNIEKAAEIRAKGMQEAAGGVKQNEAQAGGYASRMQDATSVMDELEKSGFHRESPKYESMVDFTKVPLIGKYAKYLTPEDLARQEQAERNFINAVLRRESGANITPTEFSSYEKQYFPRPGDTPKVLEQKKQNRIDALAALQAEAGPDAMKKIQDLRGQASKGQSKMGLMKPDFSKMSDAELRAYTGGQ